MNTKTVYTENDLYEAMLNYCQTNNQDSFTLIDIVVMHAILSDTYTNDRDLAHNSLCSLSTIKRSINKLCNFGLITKHLAHDNTKSLKLHQHNFDAFINQYKRQVY